MDIEKVRRWQKGGCLSFLVLFKKWTVIGNKFDKEK